MNPWVAFVLGLLIGWLVEWVIDWVYWRRRSTGTTVEADAGCRSRVAELELEVESYRSQLASLQSERAQQMEPIPARRAGPVLEETPRHDNLEELGISPALAASLNRAGIYTFAELGRLSPPKLREIGEEHLEKPGSEVEIVKQARMAAGMMTKADDLEVIDGIGPVIARMLNSAGIFTFRELAELDETGLRAIVGERIQRLANEGSILRQAKELAERQR